MLGEDVHKLAGGTTARPRAGGEVPRPRPSAPRSAKRVRGPRRRARARRPVPAGGRVHVPGLPVGGRRLGVRPDRQGQAHVRRQEPGAPGAADKGRHGVRVRVAAPHGPGGIFATSPGWRIMAASTPFDYVGLMNAALAVDDPVLMLEHVDLYGAEGESRSMTWTTRSPSARRRCAGPGPRSPCSRTCRWWRTRRRRSSGPASTPS